MSKKAGGKPGIWTPRIRDFLKSEGYTPMTAAEIAVAANIPKESVNPGLQRLKRRGLAVGRYPDSDERPDMIKRNLNIWLSTEGATDSSKPDPPKPEVRELAQPPEIQPDMQQCPSCGAPRKKMLCDGSGSMLTQRPLWPDHPVLYDVREICTYRVAVKVRQGMDPSIRAVPHYTGAPTPLLTEDHPHLFFDKSWQVVARNTQNYILNQPDPMNFVCRVTSDREILEVRLGNQTEENRDTRLSLSAFMRPPDLVVIRLGELGYPNKAAGGYLYEAIIARIRDNKRTWIQCAPSNPYCPGHLTWDASLNHLFDSIFKRDASLKWDKYDRGSV